MTNTPIMKTRDLKAYYMTELFNVKREVKVIDGIDLELYPNEIYGIAGESGCGKTTLLRLLAGFVQPPLTVLNGSVDYQFSTQNAPLNILNTDKEKLTSIRWKEISYILQGSMNVLNPVRKIQASFYDFAWPHMQQYTKKEFYEVTAEYLSKLFLNREVLNSYPHELSGGMRQRVTIALATICTPTLIIADEPTTALDVVVQRETLNLIKQIQIEQKNTIALVTHDLTVHSLIADRIGIMYAGRIIEEAPKNALFESPKHPYTRHLVQSLPRIGDKTKKSELEGAPPNLANPPQGCRFHPRCKYAQPRCREENPAMRKAGENHRFACFLDL